MASLSDYESRLSDKIQLLLDAILGFINIQQNDLFKILTIVSVVGVPPTIMVGIWGMNFKNMPELELDLRLSAGLARRDRQRRGAVAVVQVARVV